jgi:hypothetical protein
MSEQDKKLMAAYGITSMVKKVSHIAVHNPPSLVFDNH